MRPCSLSPSERGRFVSTSVTGGKPPRPAQARRGSKPVLRAQSIRSRGDPSHGSLALLSSSYPTHATFTAMTAAIAPTQREPPVSPRTASLVLPAVGSHHGFADPSSGWSKLDTSRRAAVLMLGRCSRAIPPLRVIARGARRAEARLPSRRHGSEEAMGSQGCAQSGPRAPTLPCTSADSTSSWHPSRTVEPLRVEHSPRVVFARG